MSRGYFGVGIVAGKSPENLGGLWRTAHAFGAAFIFTVGCRYPQWRQPTDTSDAQRHVPLHTFETWPDFIEGLPIDVALIGVELDHRAQSLEGFTHPERAVYVLGAEDRGLTAEQMSICDAIVQLPGKHCLNVATAGSIALYDRLAKAAA